MYITNLATVAQKLDRAIRLSMEAPQGTQWVTFSPGARWVEFSNQSVWLTNWTPLYNIILRGTGIDSEPA